jgi:hypothetical protein
MQSSVASIRSTIQSICYSNGLNNWKDPRWKDLALRIDQATCDHAHSKGTIVASIFAPVGDVIIRPPKKMSRLFVKITEVEARGGEYFKVVCDLIACRIFCRVDQIPERVQQIRKIVDTFEGLTYVRGENASGYSSMQDGKMIDITQYIYVYIEEIGYPLEMQIGHEFAAYTFAIDSRIRDGEKGLVDLWSGGCYDKVKKYLLNHANKVLQPGAYYDLMDSIWGLHKGELPADLRGIIDRLQ